ncbi:MAG: DUF2281 domain-containing protein [Chitinophagales bacterium]|nr:DUF2281 domain-containing protein [Chitinophagales bacterium]
MTDQQIYTKISLLNTEQLKNELSSFLDYLLAKQFATQIPITPKTPIFGCAKGKFKMAVDFDQPIDHFNDYLSL